MRSYKYRWLSRQLLVVHFTRTTHSTASNGKMTDKWLIEKELQTSSSGLVEPPSRQWAGKWTRVRTADNLAKIRTRPLEQKQTALPLHQSVRLRKWKRKRWIKPERNKEHRSRKYEIRKNIKYEQVGRLLLRNSPHLRSGDVPCLTTGWLTNNESQMEGNEDINP
jgi:hypothetical protein